jgi:formyltetrahydrofolate-dependent phosphoribosylglycinamide formyltransferase
MTEETGDDMTPARHSRPWRLGVLLSGSGRTLANLLTVIAAGALDAEVVCVVSSRSGVRGIEIAREAGIPAATVTRKAHPDPAGHGRAILDVVDPFAPDLLILAGYLRQIAVPPAWRGRMLNIHPALLPQASTWAAGRGKYGDRVHAAVLEHGDAVSGATVHVVTDDYDAGPPVMQRQVPVLPGDTPETLAARVFAVECELYPEAIRRYMAAHPELKRG